VDIIGAEVSSDRIGSKECNWQKSKGEEIAPVPESSSENEQKVQKGGYGKISSRNRFKILRQADY